jgi:hypothetical protein
MIKILSKNKILSKEEITAEIKTVLFEDEKIEDIIEAEEVFPLWVNVIPFAAFFTSLFMKHYYVTVTDKKLYFHKIKSARFTGVIESTFSHEYFEFSKFTYSGRGYLKYRFNFSIKNGKILRLDILASGADEKIHFIIKRETIQFLKDNINS